MRVTPAITDFSRGELSPRMEGRSDAKPFFQGVSELQNMIVLPQGGVQKRPGTIYFDEVEDTDKKSRLIPFVIDEDTRYVLEIHNGGIRVIRNTAGTSAWLTDKYTLTLDVAPAADWAVGAELRGLTSGVTCRIIKKNSTTSWVITEPSGDFTDGEVLTATDADGTSRTADQGAGYPTVASSTVTTPVYANGSATFYTEAELPTVKFVQVNDRMAFVHPNHPPKLLIRFDDAGWVWTEIAIEVPKYRSLSKTIFKKSKDLGIVYDSKTISLGQYKEGDIVKYGATLYVAITDMTESANPSTEDTKWLALSTTDENPFDSAGNYPSAVAYYQDRLVFAGTVNLPNTIWGSATADYEMFILGPRDSDPYSFNFLSERSDKIQWIAAREVMVAGTTGGEWVLGGGQTGITPSSILAKRQTSFGSANVQGILVNENLVFVQRGGRKLREYYYQNELQAYRAADLTFYSDHITESGVVSITFQSDPDPILWCLREDGVLVGLTYDKTNDIAGWHRHVTDGEVESIAVIPNDEEEQVWITVKRTIDGSDTRYIEYLAPRVVDRQRDCVYVDSCLTLDKGDSFSLTAATAADPVVVTAASHGLSTGDKVRITGVTGMTELEGRTFTVTVSDPDTFSLDNEDGSARDAATAGTCEPVAAAVTGLTHLEGETVNILVDGGPHGQKTVASGAISLDVGTYGNVIQVGLPYTARLTTMNILAAITDAKRGRINRVRARFIDTVQCTAGPDEDAQNEIIFRSGSGSYGEPAAMFTGEKSIELPGGYDTDIRVTLESQSAAPLTVAVILPETGVYAGGQ